MDHKFHYAPFIPMVSSNICKICKKYRRTSNDPSEICSYCYKMIKYTSTYKNIIK